MTRVRGTCKLPDCNKRHEAQGLCRNHYRVAMRAGTIQPLPRKTPEQRFWEKVDKTSTCWLWTGGVSTGYGFFNVAGSADKGYAHRYAYEWLVGPIPDGMQLDHLCRNTRCVNPAHLEPVEPGENYRRGNGFGGINSRKTHCPHGHAYDAPNTYVDARGQRHCRKCRVRRGMEYKRRKRAAA